MPSIKETSYKKKVKYILEKIFSSFCEREMRDSHYVRWRETRINSDEQIQTRVWQLFPALDVDCVITLNKSCRGKVWTRCEPDMVTEEVTVAMKPARLWSREVQPISLQQTRMTRITSGVQSPERELSTAVNPSRYDDTAAEEKATWKKIRKCWKRPFRVSPLSIAISFFVE